jgi:hypothetical protein
MFWTDWRWQTCARSGTLSPQGLKPTLFFEAFAARVNSCPDTKPQGLGSCYPMSQSRDMGHPSYVER